MNITNHIHRKKNNNYLKKILKMWSDLFQQTFLSNNNTTHVQYL